MTRCVSYWTWGFSSDHHARFLGGVVGKYTSPMNLMGLVSWVYRWVRLVTSLRIRNPHFSGLWPIFLGIKNLHFSWFWCPRVLRAQTWPWPFLEGQTFLPHLSLVKVAFRQKRRLLRRRWLRKCTKTLSFWYCSQGSLCCTCLEVPDAWKRWAQSHHGPRPVAYLPPEIRAKNDKGLLTP